ncbi:MAG TPA: GNAT family protein [Bacteroidia bacterium]|jgi:ribosomal-protein-alanine N-acetyltransferase|nr:GNAT family protein [Bacteroidia bacterium]
MELNKDIFIGGKTINLRVLNEKDIKGNYRYWLNDKEVVKYNSHGRFPQTPENLLQYVQNVNASRTCLVLAVTEKKSGQHIGNISLQNINWVDRNAEIAFLLGEKKYRGKGIMREAGKLLIDHGFKTLNLHRIYCGTSVANTGMQNLAKKLKMKKEGLRKEALFKGGRYLDIIEYAIINKL